MASKGKKLEEYEAEFNDKRINLIRLAYDVIKHTVTKFGVDETCISVWEGSENDYGCSDFCVTLARGIFQRQITARVRYHKHFMKRYKLNKLASYELIARLLQDVIHEEASKTYADFLENVDVSLTVVAELVLFLYNKNLSLYLKKLVELWFSCFINIERKQFDNAGGLNQLYLKGGVLTDHHFDKFLNLFISLNCPDYKKSTKNDKLEEDFIKSACRFVKNTYSTKDLKDVAKVLMSSNEVVVRESRHPELKLEFEIDKLYLDARTKSDEDSETGPPTNPGLGIPDHNEIYGNLAAIAATPSQNLPGASPEEGKRRRKQSTRGKSSFRPSGKQGPGKSRHQSIKLKLEITEVSNVPPESDEDSETKLPQNPGLGIPDHFELYRNLEALAATPSQNLPGASPEEGKRRRKQSSREKFMMRKSGSCPSGEQGPVKSSSRPSEEQGPGKSSSRPSEEQGPGNSGLDTSAKKKSRKKKPKVLVGKDATPSPNLLGVRPEIPAEYSAGSTGLQTSTSSLGSRMEQDLGQSSLDCSTEKQSRARKPKVEPLVKDATKSRNLLDTKRKSLAEYTRGSSNLQTSASSNSSGVKQQFSSSSSGKKQSSERKPNVLVAEDATPSDDLPEARHTIPADHGQGSSGLQTGLTSLRSSVEQQLRQFNLDSSEKEESSEEKPNVSVDVDVTPSDDLEAGLKIPTEYMQGSSRLLTGRTRRSILQQKLEKFKSDSLRKRQLSEKKSNVSAAEDATQSDDLLEAGNRIPVEFIQGCSRLQTDILSLAARIDQGLAPWRQNSSEAEQSRPRVNESENDDPAQSFSLPPVSQELAQELGGSSSEDEEQEMETHEE